MLTQKHLEEFKNSGISKEIAELIFRSVFDPKEIANFLGWEAYNGPAGWLYEGIDPITGKRTGIGQFKPDGGFFFPDKEKPAKYLSQKDSDKKGKYDACCVAIPGIDWQEVAADIEQLVRCVEGVKKSASSMIHTGTPTIGLSGVDMATLGRGGTLTPTLQKLCVPGRPVEIAYDSDIIEKQEVKDAAIAFGRSLKKAGCIVTVRTWPLELGKGIDDAIENVGVEEFERQSVVQNFDEWIKPKKKAKEAIAIEGEDGGEPEAKEKKMPKQSIVAKSIAVAYRNKLAWRPTYKRWYRYGAEIDGCWSNEEEDFISRLISIELSARGLEHSASYLAGILKLMKAFLAVKGWDSTRNLLPAKNGVIDLKTLKLSPHSPDYKLTWQLPYNYEPKADCKPITDWLMEVTKNNGSIVELLRSFLYSIVHGRTDIHRYLEILGPSGSGKSTFMKLATAIIGDRNTHITKLKKLEGNFETASLMDKRLVLITDSDRYGGTVETLKALTGGDDVPFEEKFIQSKEGFHPECKVIIACNEPIQAQDYIALERRRITVPFDNKVSVENQRTLIEKVNGELVGEFVNYLPGLLNWVLAADKETAEKYLKKTEKMVVGYKCIALQAIIATNPIADWADQHLIYEEGARLQVGIAQKNKDSSSDNFYLHVASWMYPNYAEFCSSTGGHLLSLKRFIMLANDLFVNQLKLGVQHTRDRVCAFFENLRLRSEMDDCPGLISGESSQAVEVAPQPQAVEVAPQPQAVEPRWQTFPSTRTDSTETRKNKALACKNQLLKSMETSKNIQSLAAKLIRWTRDELNWVSTHLLTAAQVREMEAILATNQMELDL